MLNSILDQFPSVSVSIRPAGSRPFFSGDGSNAFGGIIFDFSGSPCAPTGSVFAEIARLAVDRGFVCRSLPGRWIAPGQWSPSPDCVSSLLIFRPDYRPSSPVQMSLF